MFARLNSSNWAFTRHQVSAVNQNILVGGAIHHSIRLVAQPVNAVLVEAVNVGSFLRPLVIVRSAGIIILLVLFLIHLKPYHL